MRLVAILGSILALGCQRSASPDVFEGTIVVHTTENSFGRTGLTDDMGEGAVVVGIDHDGIVGSVLSSDKYWATFLKENSAYSVEEAEDLRSKVKLKNPVVFRIESDYFIRMTLAIDGGSQETFEAICATYQLQRAGDKDALAFLESMRGRLREQLRKSEGAYQNQPSPAVADQIEIQHNNLTQLDSRIERELNREPPRRPGNLAWHLMD